MLSSLLFASPGIDPPFSHPLAVVEGIATATEVSTIGVVYSVLVGILIYRQFDWGRVPSMLVETAALSGAILIIVGAATGWHGRWLNRASQDESPRDVLASGRADSVSHRDRRRIPHPWQYSRRSTRHCAVRTAVISGGARVRDPRNPLCYRGRTSMGIGLFAPPFGVGFYAACAIGKSEPSEAMGPIWAYLIALVLGTFLIAAIPWLSIGFL